MKKIYVLFILFGMCSCKPNSENNTNEKKGNFSGIIEYGNFSDKILIEIERDSINFKAFFTSLEQNANRIPFQNVEVKGDSINFKLQSDFYTYAFKNKWIDNHNKLQGSLSVDTITTQYILEKELLDTKRTTKSEEISFKSNGLRINGTIWYPNNNNGKALVIVTSSGGQDRSASRAEAILLAQKGFTTFHYDKRGTGNSEGDWNTATIEEYITDDVSAIEYFSEKTGIPLKKIGIKGSSQGAIKIPSILNELENLNYGIVVSCPGVTLLESDLNYWRNRNAKLLGNHLDDATLLQRKVFEFMAGKLSRADLEKAINSEKSASWFANIWIPNLDEVQPDKRLLYSPIPYFEKTRQPILIMQGKMDEIIPVNSYLLITDAIKKSGNDNYKTVLLEGASHSMSKIGGSDFPYWFKLHPEYLKTVEDWINTISNNK